MSVDLSVIIRTDFRERDKEEATLKKLEETAAILNKSEGTTSYLVDTDDSFDRWCIRDLSEGHFFIELWLFNGFWHMETSFGYHQYFTRTMGIRKTIYGYAMLLGQKDVWPCEEYYTWNSGILEEPTRTFEEWKEYSFLIESTSTEKKYMVHELDGAGEGTNEIFLPLYLKGQFPIGDTMQIRIDDDIYDLRVAGYVEEPYFCSSMNITTYYSYLSHQHRHA